jgi:hypothetical protein
MDGWSMIFCTNTIHDDIVVRGFSDSSCLFAIIMQQVLACAKRFVANRKPYVYLFILLLQTNRNVTSYLMIFGILKLAL